MMGGSREIGDMEWAFRGRRSKESVFRLPRLGLPLIALLLASVATDLGADWREAFGIGRPNSGQIAEAILNRQFVAYAPNDSAQGFAEAGENTTPTKGSPDAPVTIVGFSDFDCTYCARSVTPIEMILRRNPKQVRWVFKHFPLRDDEATWIAHRAARAAAEQGAFWEMHHWLMRFPGKRTLAEFTAQAGALGLDVERFRSDFQELNSRPIAMDREQGLVAGVQGTPTFFVNERKLVGTPRYERLKAIVDDELAKVAVKEAMPTASKSVKPDSPVEAVVYADLTNSASANLTWWLYAQRGHEDGQFRIEFRHFPATSRERARWLHRGVEAARNQGRFWAMLDQIYARQTDLDKHRLLDIARVLGLDIARFKADLSSDRIDARIEKDVREARRRNVTGAPTMFVNGRRFDRIPSNGEWRAAIANSNVLVTPAQTQGYP